ncbi:hypothetical protein BOKEGFJH_00761 [Chlamydia avium]|uniref:Membrane protein n=1 Tax=Chlamydia avium TaxID=1457141 RepID=A0ABP2X6Q4_9CHLA|nr:hypothetical protein [Chlamydia avium]EPP36217.1 putative membrane protein [Chlamydia psittaci 10_743_SC13]EPP38531.1 putative membrane protein [Chlamydia avium]VVT43225.1 hypothetical protein BOKEGFJH_00761 [Chlamydia avium]
MSTLATSTSNPSVKDIFLFVGNKTRRLSSSLHDNISLTNDLLGVISSSSSIALATLESSRPVAQKLVNLESACGIAIGMNNLMDIGVQLTQLLSGAMFYQTGKKGGIFWKICPRTRRAQRILRSPLSIASKLAHLFSKIIGNLSFFNYPLKLVNLGAHAKTVGGISISLRALASVCGALDDASCIVVVNAFKPASTEERVKIRQIIREKVLSFICNLVDLGSYAVSLVFSFAPALLGLHASLILGISCLLSAVFNLAQDIITG